MQVLYLVGENIVFVHQQAITWWFAPREKYSRFEWNIVKDFFISSLSIPFVITVKFYGLFLIIYLASSWKRELPPDRVNGLKVHLKEMDWPR